MGAGRPQGAASLRQRTRNPFRKRQGASRLIEAAGGLLWDRAEGPRRIALVHRHRHNDWALPKGKLHKGETWERAALREVEEETGYRVKLVSFAGALAYRTANNDKVV